MTELTERQIQILKAIIGEYIETAESVGSQKLEKKYELGVSPATIRNEMVKLTEAGYLKQLHSSAGRIPTPQAFKFYVDRLMEEKKLSVADEVAAKERIWDARFDFDKLMREATRALAERTSSLAVAVVGEDTLYHSGYANILDMPEFYDIDIARTIFSMIDEIERIRNLFSGSFEENAVGLLLGEELGYDYLEPCGAIFVHFKSGIDRTGSLGIIGSSRFNYPVVIPVVRYFKDLIEELSQNL